MNRRKFLKVSSVAGLGLVAGVPLLKASSGNAYYLISGSPDEDAARLLRLLSVRDRFVTEVSTMPIKPASQDLTVILNGTVIDPRSGELNNKLASFSNDMRAREAAGHTLVTVATQNSSPKHSVTFEYEGKVVDRLGLNTDRNRIEMPGVMGKTAFRIEDGQLSVLESSCRHELCAKMGSVRSGKIICAPNKLVATVNGDHSRFDGITG